MESGADSRLVDRFGRVHDYLRISLTERCNLRCTYCMPEEGITLRPKSCFMTANEVIAIARVFVELGVTKIRLTGGEPFVRRDIDEIIKGLTLLPIHLAITTNGALIDEHFEILKEAKVQSVNVSLDSLRPKVFKSITRRDYFERVTRNIEFLVKEGAKVKLNAVIIRGINDNEIADFVEYTRDKEISYRFIEYMPFPGNQWKPSNVISFDEIMSKVVAIYGGDVVKLEDSRGETGKKFRIRGYKGSFAFITTLSNPFCEDCSRIRITADGKMKNCLFSSLESDLLTAHRNGQDIRELVTDSIKGKKLKHGGRTDLAQYNQPLPVLSRPMVAIGG